MRSRLSLCFEWVQEKPHELSRPRTQWQTLPMRACVVFQLPVAVHSTIELLCLLVISIELGLKLRWIGWRTILRHKRTALKVLCNRTENLSAIYDLPIPVLRPEKNTSYALRIRCVYAPHFLLLHFIRRVYGVVDGAVNDAYTTPLQFVYDLRVRLLLVWR